MMVRKRCSVEGCETRASRRLFCTMHDRRVRLYGNPLAGEPHRYKRPPLDRFWAMVDRNGPIPANRPDLGPCYLWTGAKDQKGYGQFDDARAHRWINRQEHGPIPAGLELDHLCSNRPGVNNLHLERVTHRVNVLRGRGIAALCAIATHCKRGHEFNQENTIRRAKGHRGCRQCARQFGRRGYERRMAEVGRTVNPNLARRSEYEPISMPEARACAVRLQP